MRTVEEIEADLAIACKPDGAMLKAIEEIHTKSPPPNTLDPDQLFMATLFFAAIEATNMFQAKGDIKSCRVLLRQMVHYASIMKRIQFPNWEPFFALSDGLVRGAVIIDRLHNELESAKAGPQQASNTTYH